MAVSLSSFPLQWMIEEVLGVNKADEARGKKGLAFNTRKDDFLASMQPGGPDSGKHKALTSMAHDTMSFGKDGGGFLMALMWNIMGKYYLPNLLLVSSQAGLLADGFVLCRLPPAWISALGHL